MSKKLFHDPKHWRKRAENARKDSAKIIDPISRRMMLEIAESYENLARRAAREIAIIKMRRTRRPPAS